MDLTLDVSQKLMLSQHMMQSMEILQMSAQELSQYIEKLSMENPVIEVPESDSPEALSRQEDLQRKLDWLESTDLQNKVYYQQERSAENMEQNWHDAREMEEELSDYLLSQLILEDYSKQERTIVEFIIMELDSRGYLTDSTAYIADYFSVPETLVEELLEDIQALDPAGVGARDVKECLLLQLWRNKHVNPVTEALIKDHLDDMAKNHLQDIAKKMGVSMDEILDACEEIRRLNPKPGNAFSNREQMRYVSPDALVVKLENKFEILVNEYQYPTFNISGFYQNMLAETDDAETKKYLQDKIAQAEWVQNCISQRTSTLSRVMRVLVQKQHDFFTMGPGHKRPMKLNDIAIELDVHESTISRTLRSKYLQCSWGVFPLNYFLTSVATKSTSAVGENAEKTPEEVKAMIRKIVDEENKKKPLSDQKISEALEQYNIKISRRTVNKYRMEMGLPDKSGRKDWSL